MGEDTSQVRYSAKLPYSSDRIRAAAIYCSDGRVGQHFDEFLIEHLRLPRYDRVALPGGPACLASHVRAYVSEQGVLSELKFLVEAHGVERIVLLAHENCAFYTSRLHLEGAAIERRQREDLAKAARLIYQSTGVPNIDCFFSRLSGEQVLFEDVPGDPTRML